jgi:hypothetical protein
MWLVYQVEPYLDPVIESLCDTFLNHCEKGVKHDIVDGQDGVSAYWFKVSKDSRVTPKGPVLSVEGIFASSHYRFRSGKSGFSFAADNVFDIEGLFFDFINIMCYYQKSHNLEIAGTGYLFALAEEDSPAITSRNYVAFSDDYIEPLLGILRKHFRGIGLHEVSGKFGYTIYSEKAETLYPPANDDYVPLCEKLIAEFKSMYHLDEVMLAGIRIASRQYIYFFANGTSLFYNSEDGSREVLEREYKRITNTLSKIGHYRGAAPDTGVARHNLAKHLVYRSPY